MQKRTKLDDSFSRYNSSKRDFYQFNPQCLTPVEPPPPRHPLIQMIKEQARIHHVLIPHIKIPPQ